MESGYKGTETQAGLQGEHHVTAKEEMGFMLHKAKHAQDCQQLSQCRTQPGPDSPSTATKAMTSADTST